MPEMGPSDFDALVNAVVARLRNQLPAGLPGSIPFPGGEPDLERPPLIDPRVPLPDLLPRRALRIAGMELTQSTQHHGAAGPSYGPDNSVPLVALKTMVVRVYPYISTGFGGGSSSERVTGELVVSSGNNVVYRTGPTRGNGARAGRQADLSRTLWDEELTLNLPGSNWAALELRQINPSLNFIVPAWYCRRGRFHVSVRLWPVDPGPASTFTATASQYVEFIDVRAPRLAIVRVNWDNGMGTVTRPSDADMLDTIRLAERMLPFPYFETTILGVEVDEAGNFATPVPGGGCNSEWIDLLSKLNWTRMWSILFQLGDLLYGFVPTAAIPPGMSSINGGCRIESGASFVGFATAFAHEIGHYYGRDHVAVADDPRSDPSFPKYNRTRSIGEVGVDTGTSPPTLYDPATSEEIMSYGNQEWISPYTYQAILDARDAHQSVPADPRRVRPFLLLDVRVYRTVDGLSRVAIRKAARIDAPGSAAAVQTHRGESPLSLDLVGPNAEILATHHLRYVRPQGCGCGCQGTSEVPLDREPYLDFQDVVVWPGDQVTSLTFHRGREPIATVQVGEPPTVQIGLPQLDGDRVQVDVVTEHPRERPLIAVLFSHDDGRTWQPVAFDPPQGHVSLPVANLRGGAQCRFRAIASAELRSAEAISEPIDLPPSGRRLHVIVPCGDCEKQPGPVAMRALIDTRGMGGVAPDEVRWRSSIQGEIGLGFDLAPVLERGEHEITVSAPDGLGGTFSTRAIIIVGGKPRAGMR